MFRLGIRAKLVGAFLVVPVLFLIATTVAVTSFGETRAADTSVSNNYAVRDDIARAELASNAVLLLQNMAMRDGWSDSVGTQFAQLKVGGEDSLAAIDHGAKVASDPSVKAKMDAVKPKASDFIESADATFAAVKAGDLAGARVAYAKSESAQQKLLASIDSAEEAVARHVKVMQEEASDEGSTAVNTMKWFNALGVIVALLFARLIGWSVSRRTRSALDAARSLAVGDTACEIETTGSDEVGELGVAFESTRAYLWEAATVAKQLAAGNLSATFEPRSDKDELGNALRTLGEQLSERTHVASAVARGDLQQDVVPASEVDELGHAFAGMVSYLRDRSGDASRIAKGDLSFEVEVRSESDAFGIAFSEMVTNLRARATEAGRIADGDLSFEVNAWSDEDELGHALDQMLRRLRAMIGDTLAVAESLQLSSHQLSAMSNDVGRGMEEIAGSIGELAAGSDSQVRVLEEQRSQATEASMAIERSRMFTEGGLAAVMQANDAMSVLDESSRTVTEAIRRLSDQTNRIGDFVGAVSNIADQTNLLALNAAIEAARAGDAGRGFAVVADEVRKLAEESQSATTTIAEIVAEIQRETGATVEVIEQSVDRTAQGAQVVGEARDAFQLINDSVQESSERIAAIVGSADMVAAVAQQSSSSTEQVSAATEETSASMQEMSASSQELARTAEQLLELTGQFRVSRDAGMVTGFPGGPSEVSDEFGMTDEWSQIAGMMDFEDRASEEAA